MKKSQFFFVEVKEEEEDGGQERADLILQGNGTILSVEITGICCV